MLAVLLTFVLLFFFIIPIGVCEYVTECDCLPSLIVLEHDRFPLLAALDCYYFLGCQWFGLELNKLRWLVLLLFKRGLVRRALDRLLLFYPYIYSQCTIIQSFEFLFLDISSVGLCFYYDCFDLVYA